MLTKGDIIQLIIDKRYFICYGIGGPEHIIIHKLFCFYFILFIQHLLSALFTNQYALIRNLKHTK